MAMVTSGREARSSFEWIRVFVCAAVVCTAAVAPVLHAESPAFQDTGKMLVPLHALLRTGCRQGWRCMWTGASRTVWEVVLLQLIALTFDDESRLTLGLH